jgi:hypothetical protein
MTYVFSHLQVSNILMLIMLLCGMVAGYVATREVIAYKTARFAVEYGSVEGGSGMCNVYVECVCVYSVCICVSGAWERGRGVWCVCMVHQ